MDSENSSEKQSQEVETVLEAVEVESSEDPPMDEWPSLEMVHEQPNLKKLLYEEGLYDPGTGEMCNLCIGMSASSVMRHPYYHYPAIEDPGIIDALLKPEDPVIYPDDGQKLYLAICDDMDQCPCGMFYRGLLGKVIDLRYYGVNPYGVRAMAIALRFNKTVEILNFTDNFLNVDSCYHLGEMLTTNHTLVELNLSGCRIGPQGCQMLMVSLLSNRKLRALNLGGNELGDQAIKYIAAAVFQGLDIKMINLSHNNISGKGLAPLTEAFETHNKFTHWNLSWNSLYTPGTNYFLIAIMENTKFVKKMDLSWNSLCGLRIAQGIRVFLTTKGLKHMNLSNNKLEGESIETLILGLGKAPKLMSLNLSNNPLSPQDAITVLTKLKQRNVKVQRVYMDNITVNMKFMELLQEVKHAKPKLTVTYGNVIGSYIAVGPDARELVLNRVDFLSKKNKKSTFDLGLLAFQMEKNKVNMIKAKDFLDVLKMEGCTLGDELVDEIMFVFRGPGAGAMRTVNIPALADYVRRKYPDKKLPPTPPPEPEPIPEPVVEKPKGKGKGKGKK
ncbi:uncharacterized protein LOC142987817 [Anticarsia gemmatalis]|uniref:uncharacterized protein LOC142987817 n=1 Tax=Anticarsia gemmatalis TaxID=129554 RepID=UPI003F757967